MPSSPSTASTAAPPSSLEHERLLTAFAASAATAVATAQSVAEDSLRESIAAAERERGRWARELHDETLQGLGALRVLLASALRSGDPENLGTATRNAVDQIANEIANLRSLITELRPAALDELGLGAAIESLASAHATATGVEVNVDLALAWEDRRDRRRLGPELELAIYRLVQEALTNVSKHAGAESVWIEVSQDDGTMLVVVRDDGEGFDPIRPRRRLRAGRDARAGHAGRAGRWRSSRCRTRGPSCERGSRCTAAMPIGGMLERRRQG